MDEAPGAGRDPGLRPSVGRLIGGIAGLARARLELASVELAEERERFKASLIATIAGAIFATLAVATVSLLVVAWFWDTHRYAAIAGLAAFYALGAWAAHAKVVSLYRDAPAPFAATIAEFEKDREVFATRRDDSTR